LTVYNVLIYVPLIFIFVASRSILPGLEKPDEVMPRLVIHLANPYVAGLILAAPYGAVMSTVSGFLLIVASGLVRDVYQRFLRPGASEREIEWASYSATVGIGLLAAAIALKPPRYLQLIVVFASAGMASAFLMPVLMGAFWRRATAAGALAAMGVGAGVTLLLYAFGSYLGLRGFLPLRVRALRLGPPHVAVRRGGRQPPDATARPIAGRPALRPPDSRRPGAGDPGTPPRSFPESRSWTFANRLRPGPTLAIIRSPAHNTRRSGGARPVGSHVKVRPFDGRQAGGASPYRNPPDVP
jgi:hypothetical protein